MLTINLLSLLVTAAVFMLCYTYRRKLFRNFDVFIRRVALLVFLSGFVVYFIGFRSGHEAVGTQMSWYASVLRPLLSSMEMFAFHSDLIEVGEPCHHSVLYMTVFSVIHFAAASVSFAVAINYLGVRFRSAWRWRMLRHRRALAGDVHVFFGINEVSLGLARDIRRCRPSDTIIFINAPEDASSQGMLGFASLFNVFSFRREIMAAIDGIHGIIRQARVPVQHLSGNNVIGQLGLDGVFQNTRGFIRLYILYDDQLQNLAKNIKLRNDVFFKGNKAQKAYIYCRATSGKLNGGTAFEYNSRHGVETVLVDSAQLAVKAMMGMKDTHPANYVDFDYHTGCAKTAFHCLILGFGETGQEAFKFLYEHAQFVYSDDFKGKHVVFHIVDPTADQKRGFFETRYPCIGAAGAASPLSAEIQWHNHSAGDGRFWQLMDGIRDDLSYVVIATGSDNRNIAMAYDIGEYALRWRKRRLEKFAIVVRSYNQINECRYDELRELCIDEQDSKPIVHVIGKMSESFTHNYVWRDCLEHDAAIYSLTFTENFGKPLTAMRIADTKSADTAWWKRHASVKGNPIAYINTKRIEKQDFSNAFHVYTKLKSIGIIDRGTSSVGRDNLDRLLACKSFADFEKMPFCDALLRMEHLRLIASHECMGYTPMSMEDFKASGGVMECDVVRHKSLNLVPWDELDKLPVPEWLKAVVPESYSNRPNLYLIECIVHASLAIGLSKLTS